MDIFEIASRNRYRFDSPLGLLSTEDLWGLPLEAAAGRANLDDIAKDLYGQLQADSVPSFVRSVKTASEVLENKLEIVKHIIKYRLDELEAARQREANREKKRRILEIIESKQDMALQKHSIATLTKMLEDLD